MSCVWKGCELKGFPMNALKTNELCSAFSSCHGQHPWSYICYCPFDGSSHLPLLLLLLPDLHRAPSPMGVSAQGVPLVSKDSGKESLPLGTLRWLNKTKAGCRCAMETVTCAVSRAADPACGCYRRSVYPLCFVLFASIFMKLSLQKLYPRHSA